LAGRGPCFLATKGISDQAQEDLYKAYLNMAPSQTLKWLENGRGPASENVEIEGTEPYIVGGHTASGFWLDTRRESTVKGLFAAGDVAGGAPQKYVTGALAEGEIAAESIAAFIKEGRAEKTIPANFNEEAEKKFAEYKAHLSKSEKESAFSTEEIEEAMQKIMDEYAGGISANYRYNESRLLLAEKKIAELESLLPGLRAKDMDDLLRIYEVRERLIVAKSLIAHLKARKETRWHSFGENSDYPNKSDDGLCYVNSVLEEGKIKIIRRPLVKGENYEHQN